MSSEAPRTCVLDASALLAFLHGEPGSEAVRPVINGALISSVNWAEVVQKSLDWGVAVTGLREDLAALGVRILPFTWAQAEQAAELWLTTKSLGLSLADRACLAFGPGGRSAGPDRRPDLAGRRGEDSGAAHPVKRGLAQRGASILAL